MSDSYVMTSPTKMSRESATSFMVMSYSHDNGKLLDPLFTELYKKGADFWYDTEMQVGDNWKKTFLCNMNDADCCGMVVFASVEYLLSDCCGWEMQQLIEKKKENPAFCAYVVLVDYAEEGGNALPALYKEATRVLGMRMANGTEESSETKDKNKQMLDFILEGGENLFLPLKESTISNVCTALYAKFGANGCTTCVNEALIEYARVKKLPTETESVGTGKTKSHYKMTFGRIVNEKKVDGKWIQFETYEAVWSIFNLQKGMISLILKSKLMGACGRISAKNKWLSLIDEECFLLSENREGTDRERLIFSPEEAARFSCIRFLYKAERENKKLAEEINWALSGDYDPEANGYFYVMDLDATGAARFYYADRFSTDVYENVWRDETASVIPVIDIKA